MKKLFALVMLMVYGLSSTGMTLHFHYCCGKLEKIDLSRAASKKCGTGTEMAGKGCCDNKQLELKLRSGHNPEKFIQNSFPTESPELVRWNLPDSGPYCSKKLLPEVFAPPPLKRDINILYCTYRI
jgi:hypothetical protein